MFEKEKIMPNGAVCNFHVIQRLEVTESGEYRILVNSYPTSELGVIGWQDTYTVVPEQPPISFSSAESLIEIGF